MTYGMIYADRPADDLVTLKLADLNKQFAETNPGRTMFYLQWALALSGFYTDEVDGRYRASTLLALNSLLDANYGGRVGKYKPAAGQAVSLDAFRDVMVDYGLADDPTTSGNSATVLQTPRVVVA